MSLHAVPWTFKKFNELTWSSVSLHAVSLSEQLTRISQCLFLSNVKYLHLNPLLCGYDIKCRRRKIWIAIQSFKLDILKPYVIILSAQSMSIYKSTNWWIAFIWHILKLSLLLCKHFRPLHYVIHCLTSVTLPFKSTLSSILLLACTFLHLNTVPKVHTQTAVYRTGNTGHARIEWADNVSWTNCPGTLWFGNDMLHATGSFNEWYKNIAIHQFFYCY